MHLSYSYTNLMPQPFRFQAHAILIANQLDLFIPIAFCHRASPVTRKSHGNRLPLTRQRSGM